jgi:hypothetical protein
MRAAALLRPGLLEGVSLLVAGAESEDPGASGSPGAAGGSGAVGSLGAAVADGFSELGARVCFCTPDGEDEAGIDQAVARVGAVDVLVVDGAALFGDGGLRRCLDATWNVTRAVVNHAFLPAERGRVVYLAPAPDAGEHALAARAGLENLARTLSVEWARHEVNVVAVAPGEQAEEVAALVAYMASPAGAYFSGCLLDLGAVRAGDGGGGARGGAVGEAEI